MSKSSIPDARVNLNYRPEYYFWADDMGVQLTGSIQGSRRKALYEECLETGEEIPEALTQPTLSAPLRQALGRIHPQFMGGEYLTRPTKGEVVLARMTIDSTTADTFAIYVKRSGKRLRYRAVDEYEGSSLGEKTTLSSKEPLALWQLVDFAMEAWGIKVFMEMNFEDDGYPRDECHDFLLELSSDFYPGFEEAMRDKLDRWLDTVSTASADDEGEEA